MAKKWCNIFKVWESLISGIVCGFIFTLFALQAIWTTDGRIKSPITLFRFPSPTVGTNDNTAHYASQYDDQQHFGMMVKHKHDDESRLSRELYRQVRVFCWIMTSLNNTYRKAIHVNATWAPRCNAHIFFSSIPDSGLPTVQLNVTEGRKYLWLKTKKAHRYIYKHYLNDYDWFLKADDDTFVVVENLRFMLLAYSRNDPIYFGCKFKKFLKQGYMSGGAGYVLSREALRRFVENSIDNPNKCKQSKFGAEDVEIGKCLQNAQVRAGDSRDAKNRHRMLPFGPGTHLNHRSDLPKWFHEYMMYNYTQGDECCSDYMISFHYIDPASMHSLDFLIYHLRPFGLKIDDGSPNNSLMSNQQLLDWAKQRSLENAHQLQNDR